LAGGDSLQHNDRLFDVFSLGTQFGEHLVDVHTAQVYLDFAHAIRCWAPVDRMKDDVLDHRVQVRHMTRLSVGLHTDVRVMLQDASGYVPGNLPASDGHLWRAQAGLCGRLNFKPRRETPPGWTSIG